MTLLIMNYGTLGLGLINPMDWNLGFDLSLFDPLILTLDDPLILTLDLEPLILNL